MRRPAIVLFVPVLVALISAAVTLILYPFVHFARPKSLWWLLALIALSGAWTWKAHRRRSHAKRFIHDNALSSLIASWSPRRASIRFTLVAIASYALILASAQPQWGEQTRRIQREGIDIVIVLDASRSMLAEDAAPDRLRAATEELDRLLATLDGDRVGLVVFAGLAFTQSPLTTDYGAIRLYLNRVNPEVIPSQGTALGLAIREAHRLLKGGDNPDFRRAPHQLIIVVSDGEDHETNPLQAAAEALDDDIRVFTVGVGTSAGGRIPLRTPRGDFTGYLTDRNDTVVISRLEDQQLQEIAEAGGGAYQRYTGSGSAAAFLSAEIDTFDQAALSSILRAQYVDRGHIFLWPAFLLMFLALMIDERPRNQRQGRWLNILLVLLILAPLSGCLDFKQRDPHVRRATVLAENGQLDEALETLERANQDAQSQHEFHFNRGRIHEALERFEQAQEDYLFALGAHSQSLRTAATIGLGNALFLQGDYAAAHERYRRALIVDPDNAAARRNLEIAHQHLFPACSQLEDTFEPNNSPTEAQPLPAKSYRGPWADLYAQQAPAPDPTGTEEDLQKLTLCGEDNDWFLIPVQGGETLKLSVEFQRLRDDNGGPPLPSKIPPSSVRITLIDQHGEIRAVDQGMPDGDATPTAVNAQRLTRQIHDLRVEASGAPYFLQIAAEAGLEYHYTVQATITPPCSALEDAFEPNDTADTAARIESGEHQAHLCVGNDDWFTRSLQPDEDLFVDLQATPTNETPEPRLQSAFPQRLEDSAPAFQEQSQPGRISWASGTSPAPHTVRWGVATQDDHEGAYTMDVFHFEACPVGNDRFEPNDRPDSATPLTAEQSELRHLRLCPRDEDWFVMQLPEPDEEADDAPRAFSAIAEFTEANRNVQIEIWDPRSGHRLAVSERIEHADENEDSGSHAVIAATEIPSDAETIVIRVLGEEGFYHLRFPDTQPPQPENGESDDPEDGDDDSEADDQGDDGQGDSNDDEQQEPDEGDESGDDQTDDHSADGEDEEESEEAPAPTPPEADEDAQRRALMQLLESLEDDSFNLQLMQALEREPPSRMQNEW